MIAVCLVLPWLPFVGQFGFTPISTGLLATMGAIVFLYGLCAEAAKRLFYRWTDYRLTPGDVQLD